MDVNKWRLRLSLLLARVRVKLRILHGKRLPDLPPELWDIVFDHFRFDDDTLKACSLTCRAWLERARRHLFCTILIACDHDLTHFEQLVVTSPDVAVHVRRLSVDMRFDFSADMTWMDLFMRVTMRNLQEMVITGWIFSTYPTHIEWSLHRMFPALRILRLRKIQLAGKGSELIQLLCSCPNLSELYLSDIWFSDGLLEALTADELEALPSIQQVGPLLSGTRKLVSIDTLVWATVVPPLTWIIGGLLPLHIRRLEISSPVTVLETLVDLLLVARKSLRHLVLSVDIGALLNVLQDSSELTCIFLKDPRLVHAGAAVHSRPSPALDWITDSLIRLTSMPLPYLTQLRISLVHDDGRASVESNISWPTLDRRLARLFEIRPNLEINIQIFGKFYLGTVSAEGMEGERIAVIQRVANRFPRLKAQGAGFTIEYGQDWNDEVFGGSLTEIPQRRVVRGVAQRLH